MIRLIMCEGPNELEIMRILIKNDKLIFGEDDLLGLTPYHARQLNNSQVNTELNMYPGNDILIMRIGDVQHREWLLRPGVDVSISDGKLLEVAARMEWQTRCRHDTADRARTFQKITS